MIPAARAVALASVKVECNDHETQVSTALIMIGQTKEPLLVW